MTHLYDKLSFGRVVLPRAEGVETASANPLLNSEVEDIVKENLIKFESRARLPIARACARKLNACADCFLYG